MTMLSPLRRLILCNADGSRPIPRLVGSTTVSPPVLDKMIEPLEPRLDVEQAAIVSIEKRVHPQVADHRYVQRPLGDRDLRAATWTLPPTRSVKQDMLVHQRDAHRLD